MMEVTHIQAYIIMYKFRVLVNDNGNIFHQVVWADNSRDAVLSVEEDYPNAFVIID